jgi:hypothetical protein
MNAADRFEDRLLAQLRQVVAEHPAPARSAPRGRRHGHLLLAAAGCAAALGAIAIVAGSGDTTPRAYAVEARPGGAVEVSIKELDDPSGLQGSLEESGVPAVVDFDPADRAACAEAPLSPASTESDDVHSLKGYETADGGVWTELPSGKPWADPSAHSKKENATGDLSETAVAEAGGATFLVDPGRIQTGEKLVITTSDGTVETLTMSVSTCAAP